MGLVKDVASRFVGRFCETPPKKASAAADALQSLPTAMRQKREKGKNRL
jgi:hypothetical protein